MLWREIDEGHPFKDGSSLTQIHETHRSPCYCFSIGDKTLTVSEDHYLLCDITFIRDKEWLFDALPDKIPAEEEIHFNFDDRDFVEQHTVLEYDDTHFRGNQYWIPARIIYGLFLKKERIRLVREVTDRTFKIFDSFPLKDASYVGEKECFCISTDTKRYEVCGTVSHNSVTLRNIIFHCLTHSDDVKVALIDPKESEFTRYKNMNNVVGMANSPREACELLRLCREVMYKRNKENAARGLTDLADYKPSSPTDKVSIYGREFNENHVFEVEVNGEKKTMTAREILEWVESNSHYEGEIVEK